MQRLLLFLCLGAAAALRSETQSSGTSGSDLPDGVGGAAVKSLFDFVSEARKHWKYRKDYEASGSSPPLAPAESLPPFPLHEAVAESTWAAGFEKFFNCSVLFFSRSYLGDHCGCFVKMIYLFLWKEVQHGGSKID